MMSENRPAGQLALTLVARQEHLGVVARLSVLMKNGDIYTIKRWENPSGRLDTSQVIDVMAEVAKEAELLILTTWGMQEVLPG